MAAPPPPDIGADAFQYSTESDYQMGFASAENGVPAESTGESSFVPRPKRIACVVCRRRKLRCDGRRPSCGTCSRLGHECAYDEVRKKSGPKRGYVKQLEARLGILVLITMVTSFVMHTDYIADVHDCTSPSRDAPERPGSRTYPTNLPTANVG
jgi:hypothetical protein